MTSLSESSKNFSNVRRSRDQIFKKLLLNEDPAQPKINFFLNWKKKNKKTKTCCWKWKGCVCFNMWSIHIINFVFIRIPYFSTHFYVIQRSWFDCFQCFYLTSKLPLPRKKHWKGLFSGNHVSRFSQPILTSNVFPIFPVNHKNVPYISRFFVSKCTSQPGSHTDE